MDIDSAIAYCRDEIGKGMGQTDLVLSLFRHGFTISESIKIIRKGCSISLPEAKRLVASHPCWKEVVDANSELQSTFENLPPDTGPRDPA